MAEQLLLVCDLHDSLALATDQARLDLAGDVVELDLCAEHIEELRTLVGRLVSSTRSDQRRRGGAARQRGGSRAGRSKSNTGGRRGATGRAGSLSAEANGSRSAAERDAVREWARANDVAVSSRGRLADSLVQQYREALASTARNGGGADPDAESPA